MKLRTLFLALGLLMTSFTAFDASANVTPKVLYFGDSHLVGMSRYFVPAFKAKGLQFGYYAACGSAPISWYADGAQTKCGYVEVSHQDASALSVKEHAIPNIDFLMHLWEPDLVVIGLGDNMLNVELVDGQKQLVAHQASVVPQTKKLLSHIPANVQCVWLGPTKGGATGRVTKPDAELNKLYALLAPVVTSRCTLIDGRNLIDAYQGPDGLHLNSAKYQMWATRILEQLGSFLQPTANR